MEYRSFGQTGLETSLLGFGGFHLLEIPQIEAAKLLNRYLDAGGNYIETAANYGEGESERKIGLSVMNRRDEFILISKTGARDEAGAAEQIDRSLRNLKTDHLDGLLMHSVSTLEELNQLLGENGAYEAARKARQAGKVRFIGISAHGWPGALIEALHRDKFDMIMSTINYYDRCNYPEIERTLLPLAQEKKRGVILMKPIADGYLYRSAEKAFHYAFSRPVSVVVTGINNEQMLTDDLCYAENFRPMSAAEESALFADAAELGTYVCRQCDACTVTCPEGIDIAEVFACEGAFDRQMARGIVQDTADYALQERLRFWFGNADMARERYARIAPDARACTHCGVCASTCAYGLDVPAKLALADYKLGKRELF